MQKHGRQQGEVVWMQKEAQASRTCAGKCARHNAPLIKDGVKSSRVAELEEKHASVHHDEPYGHGWETYGRNRITQWKHTSLHSEGAVPLHPQPGEHLVWGGNMVLQYRQRAITSIADEHVPRGVRQG